MECVENIEISSPSGKSDHSLVKVQYRSQPEKLPDKIVYNYEKADYQRLRERLDIDWTTYLQTNHDDIEEMGGGGEFYTNV